MWVGVLIVAVSVVVGARVFAAVDDTVAVWAVSEESGAGDTLDAGDLVSRRVLFADTGDLGGYFRVDDELPADLTLLRGVGEGELLPRGAIGTAAQAGTVRVPVAVDTEQVPGSVGAGSVVDVYLVRRGQETGEAASEGGPALAEVTVLEAPALEESFGTSGKRQLVLAVPDADAPAFFALLGAGEEPVVTIVQRA
jgi:hypothetical protein